MSNSLDDLRVVDEKTAAGLLGVAPKTMQGWRWVGDGPRYVKMGRLVRYRVCDLKDFIERQVVDRGADA